MPDTITAAVPQQTPPQDAILNPAKVYFLSRRLPGIVHLVQYDQSLPYLAVKLYEGDEPYTVPDGAAVNIRMAKPVPSDKKVYNPAYGLSEDRHTVYIAITPQMTVVAGCTNPVIEVVVDGGVACTGTLRLEIDPNPVQETDIIDTDEYKTLEEILAEAQAAAQIVQDNEQALQDVHNNLAAIQQAASNAQAAANSAEQAAESAEKAQQEAQKALGFRTFYGGEIIPDANGDLDPSRPMSTPTAASVAIKARGDRITGLTMAGKTTQAGTGDPSPENIRPISGVGMYDQRVVLDGAPDETWNAFQGFPGVFYHDFVHQADDTYNADYIKTNSKKYNPKASIEALKICEFIIQKPINSTRFVIRYDSSSKDPKDIKDYLSAHPLTVWYRSVNYTKSTGPFYTVVELSDDPYRAVGFELTQPLFDGDTLQVGVPSGCDKMVVVDGSKGFTLSPHSGENIRIGLDAYIPKENIQAVAVPTAVGAIASSRYPARSASDTYSAVVGISVETTGVVRVYDPDIQTDEAAKAYFQSHPLIVFYKSVDYTEDKDISVALESHEMGYAVLDGTENFAREADSINRVYLGIHSWNAAAPQGNPAEGLLSSQLKRGDTSTTEGTMQIASSEFYMWIAGYGSDKSIEDIKSFLSSQYSAGTPVQVVYELATPVTYAHPVPTMIAQPGEDGTFTVTGENSLSVLLKAFQDGGDASTLNGKKWQVFKIDVPASAWTGYGTNYTAAIALSGMTAALNVVACALGSNYVGTDAAEQAMAQWDYLETGANTVTFHAAVKPTANFGVVLTTVS